MRRKLANSAALTLTLGMLALYRLDLFAEQEAVPPIDAAIKAKAPTATGAAGPKDVIHPPAPYAADEKLVEGDDLITMADAPLVGDDGNVLLTISKGLPFTALRIHENWVLVDIRYRGQPVTGWVDRKYLTLISADAPGLLHEDIKDIHKRLAEMHASSEEHLSRSEFLQSMEICSTLLKIDPTNALAYYRRGHCQKMMGDDEKAIADFDLAIQLEPTYEQAYLARGDALYSRDEFDRAMADYDRALKLDPKSVGGLYMRGRCWYAKHEFDKAIADYNAALEASPDHAWSIAHRGDALFAKKDFDGAIADFDKATQIDRSFDWAIARRADVWFFGKQDIDRAIADYTFSHALNPHNSWAIHQRGHCLEKKRDFAQAATDYSQAMKLDPEYWDFRTSLAWLLATCPDEKVRDGKKAVDIATRACELTEWKDSFSLGTLAAGYAEIGQFDKAVEFAKKAIDQRSSDYHIETAISLLEHYQSNKPYHEK